MNDTAHIIDQIIQHFGDENSPAVFKKLAAREQLLAAIWQQYQTVMSEGEIDLATKELMGLCVAITKPNEYVIGMQQRRMNRVGVDEQGELEAFAVAGFFEGFDAFAHALHVDSDLRPRRLEAGDMSLIDQEIDVNVPYVIDSKDPIVCQVYDEIKATMGIAFIPNIFKALAHRPAMLRAKWDCYKTTMLQGCLDRRTKELIAITVSAVNGCSYWVDAHSAAGRQLGLSQQALVEAACVIDLFSVLCTLAKAFRLGKRNI